MADLSGGGQGVSLEDKYDQLKLCYTAVMESVDEAVVVIVGNGTVIDQNPSSAQLHNTDALISPHCF